MTRRVPLVCTPEEARQLFFALSDYFVTLQAGINDPARVLGLIDALFRPAEEPEPTPVRCGRCGGTVHEWTNGIGGRGASCTSCGFGWGCATPAAPAAPPPAGEPAWMTPELRKNLDCMVFVDAQVFSQARASMVAAIDHAVLSALAALRAEMKGELEAKA